MLGRKHPTLQPTTSNLPSVERLVEGLEEPLHATAVYPEVGVADPARASDEQAAPRVVRRNDEVNVVLEHQRNAVHGLGPSFLGVKTKGGRPQEFKGLLRGSEEGVGRNVERARRVLAVRRVWTGRERRIGRRGSHGNEEEGRARM